MKTVQGDLVKMAQAGQFQVIVHGCNCFNTMGAGIAAQIRSVWPSVYAADCMTKEGDPTKLGNFSSQLVEGDFRHSILVINAYTQYRYGGKKDVNLQAICEAFQKIKRLYGHLRIGIPAIGCGLAGGDWNIVEKLIDVYGIEDLTYVEYKP